MRGVCRAVGKKILLLETRGKVARLISTHPVKQMRAEIP